MMVFGSRQQRQAARMLVLASAIFGVSIVMAQPTDYFGTSSVLILRLGDASSNAATAASGIAQPLYYDQYMPCITPSCSIWSHVSSTPLPTSGPGACTLASGTIVEFNAPTQFIDYEVEGLPMLSGDGLVVTAPCHAADAGSLIAESCTTTKVVSQLSFDGTLDTTSVHMTLPCNGTADWLLTSFNCAVVATAGGPVYVSTTDTIGFGPGFGGVAKLVGGMVTPIAQSAYLNDARCLAIFEGQLFGTGSWVDNDGFGHSFSGVYTFGAALPDGPTTPVLLPGLPGSYNAGLSPRALAVENATSIWAADAYYTFQNVIHFAAPTAAGGWDIIGSVSFDTAHSVYSVAGRVEAGVFVLYATTYTRAYRYVPSAPAALRTSLIAVAATGTRFRGIVSAPILASVTPSPSAHTPSPTALPPATVWLTVDGPPIAAVLPAGGLPALFYAVAQVAPYGVLVTATPGDTAAAPLSLFVGPSPPTADGTFVPAAGATSVGASLSASVSVECDPVASPCWAPAGVIAFVRVTTSLASAAATSFVISAASVVGAPANVGSPQPSPWALGGLLALGVTASGSLAAYQTAYWELAIPVAWSAHPTHVTLTIVAGSGDGNTALLVSPVSPSGIDNAQFNAVWVGTRVGLVFNVTVPAQGSAAPLLLYVAVRTATAATSYTLRADGPPAPAPVGAGITAAAVAAIASVIVVVGMCAIAALGVVMLRRRAAARLEVAAAEARRRDCDMEATGDAAAVPSGASLLPNGAVTATEALQVEAERVSSHAASMLRTIPQTRASRATAKAALLNCTRPVTGHTPRHASPVVAFPLRSLTPALEHHAAAAIVSHSRSPAAAASMAGTTASAPTLLARAELRRSSTRTAAPGFALERAWGVPAGERQHPWQATDRAHASTATAPPRTAGDADENVTSASGESAITKEFEEGDPSAP